MGIGDTFSFHDIDPHGCGIKQDIHDVVIKEIYLIHVEDSPVRFRQDAGLKAFFSLFYGLLQIKGPYDPVFRGTDRELNDPRFRLFNGQLFSGVKAAYAFLTHLCPVVRIAPEPAISNHLYVRQERGQGPHCR